LADILPFPSHAEELGFGYIICGECKGRHFIVEVEDGVGKYHVSVLHCTKCGAYLELDKTK
jgi:predicted metal-binding protein